MKISSFALALATILSFTPLTADERIWTSSDGREIKAELVSYDLEAEKVVIKTSRGEYTLTFAKLSEDDQKYLRKLAAEEAEEKKKAAERAGTTTKEVTEAGNSFHVYYPSYKNANHWVNGDTGVLEKRRCEVELFSFPGGHVTGPPEVIEKAMRWVEENTERDD